MTNDGVIGLIRVQISLAISSGLYCYTPSGTYYFICPFGIDGYAVVSTHNVVRTVLLQEWCETVTDVLREKGKL